VSVVSDRVLTEGRPWRLQSLYRIRLGMEAVRGRHSGRGCVSRAQRR